MPGQMSKRSGLRQKPGPHKAPRGSRASGGPWSFHQERPDLTRGQRTQEAPVVPHCLPPAQQAGGRPGRPVSPRDHEGGRRPPVLPVGGIPGRMDKHTADGSLLSGPPGAPSHPPSPPQGATSEAPQDVTYAQLNHSTVRKGMATPPAPRQGSPQQSPVSTLLSPFASPGRTRPQAPGPDLRPQEARELPAVDTT